MRSKVERRSLHTKNLRTTRGGTSKRGLNRERIFQKNQKTYKEIKTDGQKYYVKLDIKET